MAHAAHRCGFTGGDAVSIKHVLLAALAGLTVAAAAQSDADKKPAVERDLGADHFVAGGTVRVDKPVAGDLIAAGGDVEISAAVDGDVVLAGGNLRLDGNVGQGLYAAGGKLSVNGSVGRNARIAGGKVDLGPAAQVAGNVTVGGGDVTVKGAVKGYLQAGGGQVLIDGPVQGDVVASAGQLELGPNARIGGKLRYASREEPKRDPAAQVAGGIERMPMPGGAPVPGRVERGLGGHGGGWLWTAGLMLIAAILVGAVPAASTRVAHTLHTRPWLALLIGFVALVCMPVAALIFFITIIGVPLGLLTLLSYFVLLIVGYVATAVALGDWGLQRFKAEVAAKPAWRIAAAVLAVLAIALLGSVPFLGGLVVFAAMLLGIGAIVMQLAPLRHSAA
jgi:cytoskeletal protein CcmA (bactofilin family)